MAKSGPGRPPEMSRPRGEVVRMRVLVVEARAWARAAKTAGKSFSAWARDILNAAAGRGPDAS